MDGNRPTDRPTGAHAARTYVAAVEGSKARPAHFGRVFSKYVSRAPGFAARATPRSLERKLVMPGSPDARLRTRKVLSGRIEPPRPTEARSPTARSTCYPHPLHNPLTQCEWDHSAP